MHARPLAVHELFHDCGQRRKRHANLLHVVAVANRYFAVGGGLVIADGLDVDGDAKRRADFILAAVESADGRRVVVHRMPALAQIGA